MVKTRVKWTILFSIGDDEMSQIHHFQTETWRFKAWASVLEQSGHRNSHNRRLKDDQNTGKINDLFFDWGWRCAARVWERIEC